MIYKDVNYRAIEVKDYKGNIDTHFLCEDKTLFNGLDTRSRTALTVDGMHNIIDFFITNKKMLLEQTALNNRALEEWYNNKTKIAK